MKRANISLALVVTGFLAGPPFPADASEDIRDVSALIEPLRADAEIPGMAAAIITSDGIVARGATGLRAHGHEEKVTFEDRFHLGSCTKAMTATLIGALVEKKKLTFEDTLGKHLAEPVGDEFHEDWKDVTLTQLLRNRGGAAHDLRADGLWARLWMHTGTPLAQRVDLRNGLLTKPPAYPPGTKFMYANAGFALAGHAAELRMEKSWEDLMREHVFKPLGMDSAGFGAPGSKDKVDEPRGHRGNRPIPPGPGSDNPPAIGPGGTVHATVGDWAKFVAEHLRGARGKDGLLKADTFKLLHAPEGEGDRRYAMGWGVKTRTWAGGDVLTHNGSNTMWYCTTWIAPKRDLAVLVAGNRFGDEQIKATEEAAWVLIQDQLKEQKAGSKPAK